MTASMIQKTIQEPLLDLVHHDQRPDPDPPSEPGPPAPRQRLPRTPPPAAMRRTLRRWQPTETRDLHLTSADDVLGRSSSGEGLLVPRWTRVVCSSESEAVLLAHVLACFRPSGPMAQPPEAMVNLPEYRRWVSRLVYDPAMEVAWQQVNAEHPDWTEVQRVEEAQRRAHPVPGTAYMEAAWIVGSRELEARTNLAESSIRAAVKGLTAKGFLTERRREKGGPYVLTPDIRSLAAAYATVEKDVKVAEAAADPDYKWIDPELKDASKTKVAMDFLDRAYGKFPAAKRVMRTYIPWVLLPVVSPERFGQDAGRHGADWVTARVLAQVHYLCQARMKRFELKMRCVPLDDTHMGLRMSTRDLAAQLGLAQSSVCTALRKLGKLGLVRVCDVMHRGRPTSVIWLDGDEMAVRLNDAGGFIYDRFDQLARYGRNS